MWFVATKFGQQSEVWMHRQAAGMRRLRLRVITRKHVNPDRFPADGFDLTELSAPVMTKPRSRLLRQLQLAWWRVRNRRFGGFAGAPSEAREWLALANEDQPRVALCQYGVTAVRLSPILDGFGVPIVAHFHGFDLSSALRRPLYRRRLAEAAPRFAACVVVADYQREWLVDHGCDPSRVHKIPCGAPLDEFPIADQVAEQPCRFLMVGRLTPKKRPDLSLRAFAHCREACPDARLVVIGDGELEAECHALAEELGIAGSVDWRGAQPPSVVKQELARAGAFLQHSVTAESGDKEGWPVAIAEAAGCGLPVVSTRHASIPEQIAHGETGLLVDELDWRAMADHLITLARDPIARARMGAAARQKLSAFDAAGQVRKLEDLLLTVAAGDA
ncbi:MAG: glycosyltransferase [Planctomycetota bacterium]